jgi:hypothetical protein
MSKSYRVHFALYIKSPTCSHTASSWDCKHDGRPTTANIAAWVQKYVDSQKPGGINSHLPKHFGAMDIPTYAEIIDQFDGNAVRATWKAPAAMAI